MAMLLIGEAEQKRIAEMIIDARAHPIPLEVVRAGAAPDKPVIKLEERKPGLERPPSQHMIFPGGFRAALSVEEQPGGLYSHLSISVIRDQPGAVPSWQAVSMIAQAFNVPFPADRMWMEEFDPGEFAVNLLSLFAPRQEGHA
jgi:hypothetical protein